MRTDLCQPRLILRIVGRSDSATRIADDTHACSKHSMSGRAGMWPSTYVVMVLYSYGYYIVMATYGYGHYIVMGVRACGLESVCGSCGRIEARRLAS